MERLLRMDFVELAKRRCSVRSYQEKPVEQEKLEKILEAGRVAPTACNLQPQRILVVRTKEGIDKLKKVGNVFNAPLYLVICADHSRTWKRAFDGKDSADIDVSIVTTQMMLEAADIGLASIWIGSFKPDVMRAEFSIPKGLEPVNLLGIGYPEGEVKSPERHDADRKPLAETVFYDCF